MEATLILVRPSRSELTRHFDWSVDNSPLVDNSHTSVRELQLRTTGLCLVEGFQTVGRQAGTQVGPYFDGVVYTAAIRADQIGV
jgi:hypothetical protein